MRNGTIDDLARRAGAALRKRGWMLATAESCTGGLVAQAVTAIPGSSVWFERGFVAYSNDAKQDMLGVSPASLERNGAVSEAVVCEMARGVIARSVADFGLAVSGVAGPGGGSSEKPVGTVWLAWAQSEGEVEARCRVFDGGRLAVREQAAAEALRGVVARCLAAP